MFNQSTNFLIYSDTLCDCFYLTYNVVTGQDLKQANISKLDIIHEIHRIIIVAFITTLMFSSVLLILLVFNMMCEEV